MAVASQDFIELFQCLNAHRVSFLIVGGYAVAWHGYPRYTGDLDLFIKPDLQNAQNILLALEDFGFKGLELTAQDFIDPSALISLGYPPERVDFVCDIDDVSWEEAWNARSLGEFGPIKVPFLGIDELIKNKLASGRPQDKVDADILRRARRIRSSL